MFYSSHIKEEINTYFKTSASCRSSAFCLIITDSIICRSESVKCDKSGDGGIIPAELGGGAGAGVSEAIKR
ncbi:hypothetical protein BLOT_006830 [Blomia tropicalis]|nr:hypothetical protein BLOT_006830 [Blomia tropicalis]